VFRRGLGFPCSPCVQIGGRAPLPAPDRSRVALRVNRREPRGGSGARPGLRVAPGSRASFGHKWSRTRGMPLSIPVLWFAIHLCAQTGAGVQRVKNVAVRRPRLRLALRPSGGRRGAEEVCMRPSVRVPSLRDVGAQKRKGHWFARAPFACEGACQFPFLQPPRFACPMYTQTGAGGARTPVRTRSPVCAPPHALTVRSSSCFRAKRAKWATSFRARPARFLQPQFP
jgi:hypothetical protein